MNNINNNNFELKDFSLVEEKKLNAFPFLLSEFAKDKDDTDDDKVIKLNGNHYHQMVFLSDVEFKKNDMDDIINGVFDVDILVLIDEKYINNEANLKTFLRTVYSYLSKFKSFKILNNTFYYCSSKEIDKINQNHKNELLKQKNRDAKIQKILGNNDNIREESSNIETATKSNFINLIKKAYAQGATDVHFTLMKDTGHATIEIRRLKQLEILQRVTYNEAAMMLSAAYTSMAEDSSLSSATFQLEEIQDARIIVHLNSRDYIALRYASTPNAFGSTVVLRILPIGVDKKEVSNFDNAGFLPSQVKQIKAIARNPRGCIFVCGETGSGKSTTLKMLVTERLNERPGKRIYSIEQPVEYKMPAGVVQISVGKSSLPEHLKATLRLDPDDIVVGEVRDHDTASLLLGAEETGHGLMCSLHTSAALDVPGRLTGEQLQLPIEGVASARFISGLIFQKLVPVLCDHCKVPIKEIDMNEEVMERLDKVVDWDKHTIYTRNPDGCKHCNHKGVNRLEVCAEVVNPDLKMKEFWMKKRFLEAYEYWRATRDPDESKENAQGLTALEIAIIKMRKGQMCPIDIEREFGNIDEALVMDDGIRSYKEV